MISTLNDSLLASHLTLKGSKLPKINLENKIRSNTISLDEIKRASELEENYNWDVYKKMYYSLNNMKKY